jgi:SMC interacting uncharacterized protein involved in chromosome segregation
MSKERSALDELFRKLKTERDELALKIHLGKADAKEEWEKLEKKFQELKSRSQPVLDEVGQSAKNVGAALEMAAEEIKKGYDRIRKLL